MKKSVFVFKSSSNRGLFGLTYDSTGSDLPPKICKGSWVNFKKLEIDENDPPLLNGLTPKEILDTLDKDEYFIQEFKFIYKEEIKKALYIRIFYKTLRKTALLRKGCFFSTSAH